MNRRQFIAHASGVAASVLLSSAIGTGRATGAQNKSKGDERKDFFTLSKRKGRWWLVTPEGNPFFSIGLNHIDSASLRYIENRHIWRGRYGNSMRAWLKQVRSDLIDWGFNTVGWVQEVVTREVENHRHSRNFTYEEYQWLDMPYCHMLPFVDFHQWEVETINADVKGESFAQWCDYVARAHCGRFADDPKLIGYFYSDCPTWVHIRKDNRWKGPLFDPHRLEMPAGRRELFELAQTYYKVTHDAIRRYDK
ncbi:MAG: agarase, partial [Planctomycetota bacterium]